MAFLGLTYMYCGYLHGALGQYGYELVGAGGFGVFKGDVGDWGFKN